MSYTLYHIKGKKWGCTNDLKRRLFQQGYESADELIIEEDLDKAADLEKKLNLEYGYPWNDGTDYRNMLDIASKAGKSKIDNLLKWCNENNHFRKLGDSKIGVRRTEETIRKIQQGTSHSWRPILQFSKDGNFIKEWENFTSIEKELKIKKQPIWSVCNNKPRHKTAYGFIWKYK